MNKIIPASEADASLLDRWPEARTDLTRALTEMPPLKGGEFQTVERVTLYTADGGKVFTSRRVYREAEPVLIFDPEHSDDWRWEYPQIRAVLMSRDNFTSQAVSMARRKLLGRGFPL